jgi:hypothetical protein
MEGPKICQQDKLYNNFCIFFSLHPEDGDMAKMATLKNYIMSQPRKPQSTLSLP